MSDAVREELTGLSPPQLLEVGRMRGLVDARLAHGVGLLEELLKDIRGHPRQEPQLVCSQDTAVI